MLKRDVHALAYLWLRQVFNGIKRALGSPKRLISVLIFIGYWVGLVMRPWDKTPTFGAERIPNIPKIESSWVENGLFSAFILVSYFSFIAIFAVRNTFKPADVDILFPTPISSRLVMYFRLFREYLLTLLMPLFFLVFAFKPAIDFANETKKRDPQFIGRFLIGASLGWILLALCWVSLSYAMSFLIAKFENKHKQILRWHTAFSLILGVAVGAWIVLSVRGNPTWNGYVGALTILPMKVIFFLPWAATQVAMGGFSGAPLQSLLGLGILGTFITIGLRYAGKLSDWMYDQAATRGFQTMAMTDLRKTGDTSKYYADLAVQGKFKKGRLSGRISERFKNIKLLGGWALVYKEIMLQSRIGLWSAFISLFVTVAIGIVFLTIFTLGPSNSGVSKLGPIFYLAMVAFMSVNVSSTQALVGYQETLRRVEVIKPLPLSPSQIALFETGSKGVIAMTLSFFPFLVGLIYKPEFWPFHLAGMIAVPAMALAMVGVLFLIVVLFPDFDDPTQRSFRGIMQLLGMLFVMAPTFAIFAGCFLLKISPIVPAVITAPMNVGIVMLASALGGRFYADFNPSE